MGQWPEAGAAAALPRALRVTVTLATGEQIVRAGADDVSAHLELAARLLLR